jgi:mannosyltransferase
MIDVSPASLAPVEPSLVDVHAGLGTRLVANVRASALALDIVVVSGVALALGLIRLGAPSLWVDEAFTALATHSSFEYTITFDQYHTLYDSSVRLWAFFAGTSEWALRLPSVLGAMLSCGLVVVLGRRLVSRWAALASGLFLATSPFVVKWSQQARGYTLVLALSLAAMLLLLRALERGSRGAWLIYGLVFSAVIVWHPVSGLVLVPAHVALVAPRRRSALPHCLVAAAVIFAVAVPWAATIAMRTSGEDAAISWLKFPTPAIAVHALLDVSGVAGLGVLLALIGLWVLHRAGKVDLAVWLGIWAFTPFVVALLVSTIRPIYLDRYLVTAAPAFALLAGVAVTGVGSRMRAAILAAVVIATSAGLLQLYAATDRGNWRGEDWKSAVNTVLERRSESDAIVVVPWWTNPAATYYRARVSDVSTADSIWVLVWSETGHELPRAERRPLGFGDHRLVEKLQFGWRVSAQHWKRER